MTAEAVWMEALVLRSSPIRVSLSWQVQLILLTPASKVTRLTRKTAQDLGLQQYMNGGSRMLNLKAEILPLYIYLKQRCKQLLGAPWPLSGPQSERLNFIKVYLKSDTGLVGNYIDIIYCIGINQTQVKLVGGGAPKQLLLKAP